MTLKEGAAKELRTKSFPVKLTNSEFRILKLKALEYTKGNISEWMRYASLNLLPNKRDLDDSYSDVQKEPK